MRGHFIVFSGVSLLLTDSLLSSGCEILRDKNFRSIGVTKEEAKYAEGIAVVVYDYMNTDSTDSINWENREKIIYKTDEDELASVDGYLMVDRNNSENLLVQAHSHTKRPGFRGSSVVCVLSERNKPSLSTFALLWFRNMHFVVVQCSDRINYVYDPFSEQIVPLKESTWVSMKNSLRRIWRDMKGTVVKISAIQEPLSFVGRKVAMGRGLDASFLYEFSRQHNFTPNIIYGNSYRQSNLQVWTHQAEIGANARFFELHEHKIMYSHVIYGDSVCHVIKKKSHFRGWEVYQALYRKEVWFCFLGIILLTNLVLVVTCRQRDWSQWMGITSRALLSIPLRPIMKESKERFIVGSCFLFSLIFISYTQGMLFKILRGTPPVEIPDDDNLSKYVKVLRELPFVDSYTVMRKKGYELHVQSGLIKPYDYAIKCPGNTRNFAYVMTYGSPFEPSMNRFVLAAFESGLPEAWYTKTLILRKRRYAVNDVVKVLSLTDFEVAFFELLIGLTISTAALCGEILKRRFVYVG